MNTSQTSYHTKPRSHQSPYEFIAIETTDLERDAELFLRLRDYLETSEEPETIRANSIDYVDAFLEKAVSELERRRKRMRRAPAALRGAYRSRYDDMRELTQDLKARLPLARYVEGYVPWTMVTPAGDRLRGRCPFPGHQDDTASFVVYPDDHAWCFGCQRGGDLFRVVALIEGLPTFREQLRFVADLVEPGAQGVG